ncbi:WG repeat-containing protein [Achromobacter dolens]|uniref:WG repeat-containing protein n=1 Tax=Achromobacter dolens TaxID=1287738 RepID=UPI0006C8E37A|nr:WG repeat-containing protein [Achromobacter dolens]
MRRAVMWRPLALAAALAGLHAGSVRAEEAFADWQYDCVGRTYAITPDVSCNRDYAEGLAAVLTGKASDAAGTWGYIDKQGRMAITPAYQDAESFQNGLAAVRQDGLWGYIDTRGAWVIKPRFARASGFNAAGTALVEDNERDVLINRQGQVVKTFELGTRSWGFEPGQKLAAMEVPQAPRLFNTATGRALTLPADVMRLERPVADTLPAQRRSTRYGGLWGLLDADGKWAIAPEVLGSDQPPLRDGDTLAVHRDEAWAFVRPDGSPLTAGRYESVVRPGAGLWLVKPRDTAQYVLLDANLRPMRTFTNPYVGVEESGGWKVLTDVDAVVMIAPGGNIVVTPAAFGRVTVSDDGLAWLYAQGPGDAFASDAAKPASETDHADAAAAPAEAGAGPADPPPPTAPAIIESAPTPTTADASGPATDAAAVDIAGPTVDAAVDNAVPAAVEAAADAATSVAVAGTDSEATLRQIYRADGTALLDSDTAERLGQYRVLPFSPRRANDRSREAGPDADQLPLALLRPNDYQQPTGILTRSGRIVTNPDWDDMSTYDAAAPLLVKTRKRTVGAIDAEGNWILPPTYAGIGGFKGAYSWARTPGMSRDEAVLIDTRGNAQKLPAYVEVNGEKIDGDLLYFYKQDERRNRRWGLWNIRSASVAVAPTLGRIEDFQDNWAKAQDRDRWGIIDRHGKWVVPATYTGSYDLDYLGNGYLLVREPKGKNDSGYRDDYRLIHLPSGKRSAVLHEKPQDLKHGRYLGQGKDGGTLLFDAGGGMTRLFDGVPERQDQFGDWIYVQYRSRNGAIDARGNLRVSASNGEFNPFFVQPEGLARVYDGQRYRLMDENGKALLEKLGDGTPLASMQRVIFRDRDTAESVMTDLQGREITRFKGEFAVEEDTASEGVVAYRGNGDRYGFVNAAGKRIVGPYFNKLGPLRDGLALARRDQRSGKLLGYIDLSGRYVIPPEFGWAGDFKEGRALVRRDRLLEFIDTRGKTTAIFGLLCGQIIVMDGQERVTWPREELTCPDAVGTEGVPVPESTKAEQS